MARESERKGMMRRISIIFDKSKPKGAKGRAAIKRDRKNALQKGMKPSDFNFKI